MKKNIITGLIIMLATFSAFSQNEIWSGFNSTMAGRSIVLNYNKKLSEKKTLGLGLRFNINKLSHNDDQNKVFYKRLYATKPIHYLAVNAFYHRSILTEWEHIKPFLFYDIQATYSTTRNRDFLPHSYYIDGTLLYKEHLNYFGPFTWIEQNIGVGFKADLSGNWFLLQKFGVGSTFILGYEQKLLAKYFNWFSWEFGYLFNVGIGYRFDKK